MSIDLCIDEYKPLDKHHRLNCQHINKASVDRIDHSTFCLFHYIAKSSRSSQVMFIVVHFVELFISQNFKSCDLLDISITKQDIVLRFAARILQTATVKLQQGGFNYKI